MKHFFTVCCLLICLNASAQQDSLKPVWYRSPVFSTAALPVVFIGYGLGVQGSHTLITSSTATQSFMLQTFPGFHTHIDDGLAFTPSLLAVGLKAGGVPAKDDWCTGFVLYAASFILQEGVTQGLKYTVREWRPDHSDNLSFPSSHTSFAFQGAEFLHQEYMGQSCWYSVAGYTLATATGAMRMMNNKHWLSDVCVGAGIGIAATRLVYLAAPWVRKQVRGCKHGINSR